MTAGPVMATAEGTVATVTVMLALGLQKLLGVSGTAVTVCVPPVVQVTTIALVPLPVNVPPVTVQFAFPFEKKFDVDPMQNGPGNPKIWKTPLTLMMIVAFPPQPRRML